MTPNLLSFATSTLEEIEYTLDMEFPSNRGMSSFLFDGLRFFLSDGLRSD